MVAHADARASLLAAEEGRLEAGTSELQRSPTKSESRKQSCAARSSHYTTNGRHPSPRPLLARAEAHSIAAQMSLGLGADVARSWRRCGSVLAQMWLGPGADVAGPLLLPRRQVAVMMRKGPFWGGRDNPAAIPRRRDPHGKPETAWTPLSLRGGPGLRRDGPGLRLGSRAGLQHGRSLPGGGRVHVRAAFWRDRFAYLERRRFQPEVCEDLQATACGTGPTVRRASGNGSTQGRPKWECTLCKDL
jgi:hypothetical protein